MAYSFDAVGNVLGYENNTRGHTTSQNYTYDALYQLTKVNGNSVSHPGGKGGSTEYVTNYQQVFSFSNIGNMTGKVSTENVSNPNRIGDNLNYNLDYAYYKGTHKAERIGTRYYDYDLNGNLVAEREGGHAANPETYRPYYRDGDLYWTEYGFGLVRPEGNAPDDGVYQRNYRWNERNLLSESSDGTYTVRYRYGADGQRALKFVANTGRSTVYFNKMWQASDVSADWLQSKHIYVGEDRIATKYNSEGNMNTQAEKERTYDYHSDHLGSAQTVTDWRGRVHERLEYTPYGELWIDWRSADAPEDGTPFRFTGKELDKETGLYYFGARYLDPKTSRWLSGDPAMGEYFPVAPVNDDAKKHNENLPGQGGVFNNVNLHVYHYAGNNPVKHTDPDGRDFDNYTENTYIVLPGDNNATAVVVGPGQKYEGSIDGAFLAMRDENGDLVLNEEGNYVPDPSGPIYKVNDGSSLAIINEGGVDNAYITGIGSPINGVVDFVKGIINRIAEEDIKDLSGVYMPRSDKHRKLWIEWKTRAEENSRDGARETGLSDKIYRTITFNIYVERLRERR
jgi:RHS repeat-associated protein